MNKEEHFVLKTLHNEYNDIVLSYCLSRYGEELISLEKWGLLEYEITGGKSEDIITIQFSITELGLKTLKLMEI